MHSTNISTKFVTATLTTFGNDFEFFRCRRHLPNVADVRDVGVFELGLALGVSGVVGGGFPEVGQTHWSGLGTVFRYRGPQTGRTKKSAHRCIDF